MKHDYKKLGPLCIDKRINLVSFSLALPSHFRIDDVFHGSLLEPHYASELSRHKAPHPPPGELMIGKEYEVDQILDSFVHRRRLQYLILWKGYPLCNASWELDLKNLQNALKVVNDFDHPYPQKLTTSFGRRCKRGDNVTF